jgi:hypothetical protein
VSAVLPLVSRSASKRHVGDNADISRHLHVSSNWWRRRLHTIKRAAAKAFTTCDFDSDGVCDQLHSTRAAVVVGGAHHFCLEKWSHPPWPPLQPSSA